MSTTLLKKLMVVAVGGLFVASAASTQLAGQAGAGRTGRRAGGSCRTRWTRRRRYAAGRTRSDQGDGRDQGAHLRSRALLPDVGLVGQRHHVVARRASGGRRDAVAEVQQALRRVRVLRHRRRRHRQPPGTAATGEHSARVVQDREQPVLSAAVRPAEDGVPEAAARRQRIRVPASCVGGVAAHLAGILRGHRRRLRLVRAATACAASTIRTTATSA